MEVYPNELFSTETYFYGHILKERNFSWVTDKLYFGVLKDLHHMREIDYIVSPRQPSVSFIKSFFYILFTFLLY